ncbi:hypothetical protein B0T16DRAFT_463477 [Cercophora newfieldiana]|uniref:Uncharacterized protein n=1 Tax=Cercophora newfieldiana TaxID=92897 RepID=A0AA40CJW6_9PEZI|nr:hypothetical protein B0T16DRAFT_463477 [Cercophora newfieldiana]
MRHSVQRTPKAKEVSVIPKQSISLFTTTECSNLQDFRTYSLRLDSWAAAFEATQGCQAIDPKMDIWSIRLHYLDEKCNVTVYTDIKCTTDGVTLPVEACVSNDDVQWKSIAFRGCNRVA